MNPRAILLAGAAIAGTIALVVAAVFFLLHVWDMPPGAARAAPRPVLPAAAPPLQSAPQFDLAAERARQEQDLDGVGWVDREHGIARIPIDAAMDILAQRGGSR